MVTQDKDNGKKRFERVKSNAVLLRRICKIDNNKIVERKTWKFQVLTTHSSYSYAYATVSESILFSL